LILREFHGFDYAEIGRLQDVPVGTVRSRLFRARETLRRQLRPGDEDTP
jgi:RNA polymerase sigma-70 factor (ECF subfamily)